MPEEPGTPTLGGGGARITLHAELFPSLLPYKGKLSGIVGSLIEENIPNSPCYSFETNKSSIVEFENQNLPLLRNIHIDRCALRGSLPPPTLGTRKRSCEERSRPVFPVRSDFYFVNRRANFFMDKFHVSLRDHSISTYAPK